MERVEREEYLVTEGGVTTRLGFLTRTVADHRVRCPNCGGYCTGFYRFWFVTGDVRQTVFASSYELDALITLLLEREDRQRYEQLPEFIRCGNEARGWEDTTLPQPTPLDIDDTRRALQLLRQLPGHDDSALLADLLSLLDQATQTELPVFAASE